MKHKSFQILIIILLSQACISNVIGQGGTCVALVDVELASTPGGTTTLDPEEFYDGDFNSISNAVLTPATLDCSDDGLSIFVTLSYTLNGNMNSCFSTAKPVDNTAPVLTIPANVTIDADPGQCGAKYNSGVTVTAVDNCDPVAPVFESGIPDGGYYPAGVNTVTWSATDDNGNQTIQSYTVTINANGVVSINTWMPTGLGGGIANWSDQNNWTLGVVPTLCHDVIIPNTMLQPIINFGDSAAAHSVMIQPDASLTINAGALLIYNSDGTGMTNRGTIDNQGLLKINIGYIGGAILNQAMYNSGTITNYAGARIILEGGTSSILDVDIPMGGAGTFDIQLGSTLTVDP